MIACICICGALMTGSGCRSCFQERRKEKAEEEPGRSPVFMFFVNGGERAAIYRGWPVEAYLELCHSEVGAAAAGADPIVVSLFNGENQPAAQLDFRRADGAPAGAAFKLVPLAEKTAVLDGIQTAMFIWWLDANSSATLSPGDYELAATYNPSKPANGGTWSGKPVAKKAFLRIEPEPAESSRLQREDKAFLSARSALMFGNQGAALRHINDLLAVNPDSINAWELKGDLADGMGDRTSALDAYGQALSMFHRKHPHEQSPETLYRKHHKLLVEEWAPEKKPSNKPG